MPLSDAPAGIFLDMIGGIAGDMFIAAMTDLEPDLEAVCRRVFAGIHARPAALGVTFLDHSDVGRLGRRFRVDDGGHEAGSHAHLAFREAIRIVQASDVPAAVKTRSERLFEILAKAEGEVHGTDYRDVEFHEIGGWDSIVDVMLSAAIIESLGAVRWRCGPVPMGRGTVAAAHGLLPVPAPATLALLRGFSVYQDEHAGERVTPTGAAILRHLEPEQSAGMPAAELLADGCGYGTKRFDGLANVLRAYAFAAPREYARETIGVLEFDVDDQSPEDLAMGLDTLRRCEGVLDVVQTPTYGKQGRVAIAVRALVRPDALASAVDVCLSATSSIGARWHLAERAVLPRESAVVSVDGDELDVKRVRRPGGAATAKIESRELERHGDSYAAREALRARVAHADKQREADDD